MKHFINKDQYFSFKEFPNKGNIINSVSGIYASDGQIAEELVGETTMTEFPKSENILATKEYSRYNFPKEVKININYSLLPEEISKYNGGFRYEIWVLRARNKRDISSFGSDEIEYKINSSDEYSTNISDVEESAYYKLTTGYLPIVDNYLNTDLTFYKFINVSDELKLNDFSNLFGSVWDVKIGANEAVTYFEPNLFDKIYAIQSFLYCYKVKIYGKSSPLKFEEKFSFSDSIDSSKFNVELQQNELLSKSSNYKGVNLANNIANRIFENYKNGRPTAELDWIGDPNVKVGDTVVIDGGIEYFIYGKKIYFNGGYGEKLLLIKKSSWTSMLSINSRLNGKYVLYVDGSLVTGTEKKVFDAPQYSTVTIPMAGNEEFTQVYVGETIYNMPQLQDISFVVTEDTSIYFNKSGGTIN